MTKFDKKVLKYVSARQENDLELDDIAIGLRLDEYDVRDALDSLQEQGKIEGSTRNGKTYWHTSIPEMEPEELSSSIPEETEHLKLPEESDVGAFDLDQLIKKPDVKHEPAPVFPNMENDVTQSFSIPEQLISKSKIDNMDDDIAPGSSPRNFSSPIISIAIAVVLSVVISAMISMIVAANSQKDLTDRIQVIEQKSTENSIKLEKRIAEVSAQLSVVSDKLSGKPQSRIEQIRASAAASKLSHVIHRKKVQPIQAQAPVEESESPVLSPDPTTTSTSDFSPLPSSSEQSDNPPPVPESTPLPSTEGSGEGSR